MKFKEILGVVLSLSPCYFCHMKNGETIILWEMFEFHTKIKKRTDSGGMHKYFLFLLLHIIISQVFKIPLRKQMQLRLHRSMSSQPAFLSGGQLVWTGEVLQFPYSF